MMDWQAGYKFWVLGSVMALSLPLNAMIASPAAAEPINKQPAVHSRVAGGHGKGHTGAHRVRLAGAIRKAGRRRLHYVAFRHFLQCVPFARAQSGIALRGNAVTWWDQAAGVYARGNVPEAGSVLNFRANRVMPLGHVAVVRQVVDSRQILIDQANWATHGAVSRHISVIDVSPANDWSAVRVQLGGNGAYGSIYPTYGFIYDRPANDGVETATSGPADATAQPAADEVAEAPSGAGMEPIVNDAPARDLQ